MYAYCRQCRSVYDILALHQGRAFTNKCPECDVPLHFPSTKQLRHIELRKQAGRKPS